MTYEINFGQDSPITTGNCSDDDGYASIYLELKSGDSPKVCTDDDVLITS